MGGLRGVGGRQGGLRGVGGMKAGRVKRGGTKGSVYTVQSREFIESVATACLLPLLPLACVKS